MATRTHHGRRASLRWIRRAVLGLLGLLALGLAAVLITLHTDAGRELIRAQVQAGLDRAFVGGASIGRLEGSPFGTLVIRDLVINGPDSEPAIQIGRVEVELALLPLASSEARLDRVYAEDVDIVAKRGPDGTYQLAQLVRLSDQPSAWSVHIRDLAVERARIAIDAGAEGWHHLDDVRLHGAVDKPLEGPLDATVSLRAAWRERGVGLAADAVIASAAGVTQIPSLTVLLGGVSIEGQALRVATHPGQPPQITGRLDVRAPAVAVAQLAPGTTLPADVSVTVVASAAPPWSRLSIIGQLGTTPVRGLLAVDVGARRASGVVATGDLDLAVLSRGRAHGTAGFVAMLEAAPPAGAGLPRVTGMIGAWGTVAGAPPTQGQVAVVTGGDLLAVVVGAVSGETQGTAFAEVRRRGDDLHLVRSRVIARTANAARLTGGAAPLRGVISIDASAAGALTPTPDLAVTGRVRGTKLRVPGTSVASLELAIDARQLPRQPLGRAALELRGIVREDLQLGALTLTAANRADGRIQVSVRSRPTPAPWLVELDALVTPPGRGERVIVDLQRHRVRTANAGTWRGASGHLEIDPRRVTLRDLRSRGRDGTLGLAGTFVRAGRGAGDLTGRVTVTGFALDNVRTAYRGRVDARVDVSRTNGRWSGGAELAARGLARDAHAPTIDLDATVRARADQLTVDARVASAGIGAATLVLDVDAPKDVADARAWVRLHRDVIREARVTLERVDLGRLAALAGQPGALRGRLDGDVRMSPAAISGGLHLRDVHASAVRGVGRIDADLTLAQRTPRTLTPTLGATLGTIGRIRGDGVIELPAHPFDPAAWRALGAQAFGGATLRIADVVLEPGLLDRFGVVTDLRGRASVVATVGAGLRKAELAVEVRELRGSPISEPVIAQLTAAIDGTDAHTELTIRARSVTLLELSGRVPITLAQLRRDPRAVLTRPLQLTGSVPSAPAPALLGVFGRNEVTAGTIAGTFTVRGTVVAPRVSARLEGLHIAVPPGRGGKPVKTLDRILIEGGWDGRVARLSVDGTQQRGRLQLAAVVEPRALARSTATIKATAFDLAPLLAFAPGPAGGGAGRLDADLRMTGLDPGSAQLAGELHLVNARLPLSPQVGTLRRARVDVVVGARTMSVNVTGKLGPGDLAVASTFALAGAIPTSGTAKVTLRKVSPIGSVEPVIDADIDATLERQGTLWKAAINVRKGVVRVPKGRGEKLGPIGAPPDMVFRVAGATVPLGQPPRTVGTPPAAPGLVARIRIYTLYIEAPEIRGLVKGRLTVSADAQAIGVVGTIEADRGVLDLFGRRYALDRAAVRFDGSTDPLLDVRISYDFPEVTTITEVTGRLSDPDLVMTSTPSTHSQGQLLGYLLGGEPSGVPEGGGARELATEAGASFIANKIGGYVREALPIDIDVLRYEAASATSSAAITVGTWLTRSLFLAYQRRIEARPDENSNQGELEYWLSRRVMVEGVVGDRGYHGVDLLWRRRY